MKSCDRSKEKVYTEKGKSVSVVKGREREGVQVHWRTIEERVYQTLEVALNGTSIFIGKKNGKKYIVENIGTKKVFTKLNLRWWYINIQIKEGNEWKAVFTTLKGSFKPMVMFFRLTNLLVIFQTVIKILQDLINTKEVASFIDDVIIGMEKEEVHNEVVEKVVKQLAENYLYIKPKKYKWKVREVKFLEVVIEPEKIKMEKSKCREC